jgi:hypothetical protein
MAPLSLLASSEFDSLSVGDTLGDADHLHVHIARVGAMGGPLQSTRLNLHLTTMDLSRGLSGKPCSYGHHVNAGSSVIGAAAHFSLSAD